MQKELNKIKEVCGTYGEMKYIGWMGRTVKALEKRGLIMSTETEEGIIVTLPTKKEQTLIESQTDYKMVQDNKGNQYKVERGQPFLNLMMKLQKENRL